MSRARPIILPNGKKKWFDVHRNGEQATAEQLELLATIDTACDLDDLLDESLTQGQVIARLREALGSNPIPREVLDRRQKWREQRRSQPKCRICAKEGDSTKHHFVNKWILRELSNYQQKWAQRTQNCIPLCIDCHRNLHARDDSDKSIVEYLSDKEKQFVHAAIKALLHERPVIFELQVLGDARVYEARLIQDWCRKEFLVVEAEDSVPLAVAA